MAVRFQGGKAVEVNQPKPVDIQNAMRAGSEYEIAIKKLTAQDKDQRLYNALQLVQRARQVMSSYVS